MESFDFPQSPVADTERPKGFIHFDSLLKPGLDTRQLLAVLPLSSCPSVNRSSAGTLSGLQAGQWRDLPAVICRASVSTRLPAWGSGSRCVCVHTCVHAHAALLCLPLSRNCVPEDVHSDSPF